MKNVTVRVPKALVAAAANGLRGFEEAEWQYTAVQLGRAALQSASAPAPMVVSAKTRKAIEGSLEIWAGPLREGAEPDHILHQISRYIVSLLEVAALQPEEIYEDET